jgi:hypothetical protein
VATQKFKRNFISHLRLEDDTSASEHEHKAAILWNSFKDRLGQTEATLMQFDLSTLIQPVEFGELDQEFSHNEIDKLIAELPLDKALGPYGFNGMFLKKCWPIIKEDFYALFDDLYHEQVSLQYLSSLYITLVPKTHNPTGVNDYRHISLLGGPIKLITKLLANRLQGVITQLVHENQYGFIKQRSIQDCLGWAFQYLHLCHSSKNEIVILKLDFKKAFDKIEHHVIMDMMRRKGFPSKWLSWVSVILSSGTSQVLLNGVPGNTIHCRRGVRQGDPLSPLLFVLAADLLQSLINAAYRNNLISLPLGCSYGQAYLIVQYADDTLIIMPAETK